MQDAADHVEQGLSGQRRRRSCRVIVRRDLDEVVRRAPAPGGRAGEDAFVEAVDLLAKFRDCLAGVDSFEVTDLETLMQQFIETEEIKVERGGDYVRLYSTDPALFFKHRDDPSDSFDRENFNDFKRILLSEEDCADGPRATIELIRSLLEKFAEYTPQRS